MKSKRFLSMFLSIVILFSMLPMTTLAAGSYNYSDSRLTGVTDGDESSLPRYTLELFKDDNGNLVKTNAADVRANSDQAFYLGIKTTHFDRFTAMAPYGLSNLTIQVTYNMDYFELEPTNGYVDSDTVKGRIKTYATSNSLKSLYNTGATKPSTQSLTAVPYKFSAVDTNEFITLTVEPSQQTRMGVMDSEEYVGFLEFKIRQMPAEGVGVDSFVLGRSSDSNTIALGTGTNKVALAYNSTSALETMLVLDESEANIFPDQYKIEFYDNSNYDNKIDNDLSVEEGSSVSTTDGAEMPADTVFDAYAPTGELFAGLKYLDKDNVEQEFKDTTNITADMVDENNILKVYATYKAGNTITFKSNYPADTITDTDKAVVISKDAGTKIPTDKQPTVSNDAGADFAIPDGYTFDGWYDAAGDGANKVDLATATFTGNTDLYAHWKQQINITFHKNANESPEETTVVAIAPGDSIPSEKMPADPTRADDYDFAGWNTMSNGSGDTVTAGAPTFDEATDVYALWTATGTDQVTLHFDPVLDGVTANPADVTVNKGDAIHVANIPVVAKDDYRFDGWFKTAAVTATDIVDFDNSGNGYTLPNDKAEETVYAHWTYQGADAVDVTFKKEKADSTDYEDYIVVPVKPGTSLGASMPANPTKDGKTFTGWNTAQDGSGTAFTGDTTVSAATTVYAQYVDDISITYNANTGTLTGDLATNPTVTKPAGDDYADPAAPTKDGYTFIGWNTKQSGGGEYIEAGANAGGTGNITYGDVGAQLGEDKTLYAQWAAVKDPDKDDVKDDNPVNPDPDKQGAVVNFNENVSASTTDPITSAVSPSHKYPKLGETLASMGGLPEAPSRGANYTFLGWNTQPDGSGVPFDENTTVDTATLGDALTIAADGTGSVTVYAQWKLADDYTGDKIKLTFSKNTDGTGSDKYKEIELVKGDALGYVPTVSNGDFEFNGWFGGTVTDGKVVFDESDEFDADAAIDANTTYYAKWQQYIVIVPTSVRKKDETGTGTPIADGIVYANKEYTILYNVYTATLSEDSEEGFVLGDLVKDESNNDLTNIDLTAADSPIPVTYSNATDSSTTLKTAGTYTISADAAGSYLEAQGYELLQSYPESVEITPALVTVKVDPDTQIRKSSDTNKAIGITYEGFFADEAADKGEATATVNYRKWTPADTTDTTIETTELDVATTVVPADVAKYVVEVKIGDTNYKVGNVVSSTDGTNPILYPREADATYPGYGAVYTEEEGVFTLTKPGENIYYEIQVSDPSIKTVDINTVDGQGTVSTDQLALKQSDYTADQTFDNAETPTVTEYYSRIAAPTEEEEKNNTAPKDIQFTLELTNPDTTTVTAVDGDGNTLTVTQDSGTKKWTVTAPINKTGATPNVIKITTKAGAAADAPTITYTFNVQQLVRPEIVLNYGNSPYGEIMRAANIAEADKDAAKTAFAAGNTFSGVAAQYLPVNARTTPTYTVEAWGGSEDSEVNMDRNDYAIFGYEQQEFFDTGFTAKDALGNDITSQIVRTIEIKRLTGTNINEAMTDAHKETITFEAGSGHSLQKIVDDTKPFVRPDVYVMKYTYHDATLDQDVEVGTRNIIILPLLGDVDIQDGVNNNDTVPIVTQVQRLGNIVDNTNVEEKVANLFLYRVCDTDYQDGVNNNDTVPIVSQVQRIANIVDFYNETTAN